MQIHLFSIQANARHIAGMILGRIILRPLGLRFDKSHRGQHVMFSHVSANLSADGIPQALFPYALVTRKGRHAQA